MTVRGPLALGRDERLFPTPVVSFFHEPCRLEVRAGDAVLWLFPDSSTMFRGWFDLNDGQPVRVEWVTPNAFHRVLMWLLDAAWEPESGAARPTLTMSSNNAAAQRALRAAQRLARLQWPEP